MNQEELRARANGVNRLFEEAGWTCLEAEWTLEREKIIGLIKKAVEEGKTEAAAYAGAELAGFDRALKVPLTFRQIFQEFLAEAQQKEKEHDA